MPHSTCVLKVCSDGLLPKFTSSYPDGTRPAIGNCTIWGKVKQSNVITIKTSNNNFGSTGPTLLYRTTLSGSIVGTTFNPIDGRGNGILNTPPSGFPTVIASSSMPHGKALQIGTTQSLVTNGESTAMAGQLIVVSPSATSKFYNHWYSCWPQSAQNTAQAYLDAHTTLNRHGVKDGWLLDGGNADSDTTRIDWYHSTFGYYTTGQYWTLPNFSVSNDTGTAGNTLATIPGSNNQLTNQLYLKTPTNKQFRSEPLITQRYIKFGTSNADLKFRRTVYGVGLSDKYYHPQGNTPSLNYSVNNGLSTTVDRCHMPGFIRGFNIPDGMHLHYGDIYMATGDGAPARVEITDNIDYDSSTRISICTILNWSSSSIKVLVEEGCFYGEDLTGKCIHIHDMDGNHVVGVTI